MFSGRLSSEALDSKGTVSHLSYYEDDKNDDESLLSTSNTRWALHFLSHDNAEE